MPSAHPAPLEGMKFVDLFHSIAPEDLSDNVFTLVGKDLTVVTAGQKDHYNSMTASGGGFGLLFLKPATWCIIRADRYTLELIQKEQSYTLSYFHGDFKQQVLFLGSGSGRDHEKMKEVALTAIATPSGNMSFQEARLIVECRLTAVATAHPDDFCTQEARDYINEAYREANVYRKWVFGAITRVWVRTD